MLYVCRVKADVADVMAVVDSNGTMLWMHPVNFFIRCQDGPDNRVTHCGLKLVTCGMQHLFQFTAVA